MNNNPVLILFAKKPVAGEVKTRLSPPLSANQARQVAMTLIDESLDNACRHWPGPIELSLWPDSDDEFVETLSKRYTLAVSEQSAGNLGDKMYAAMAAKLANHQAALIMGCDVPHCCGHILQTAFAGLAAKKNVIGPTIDGGYYCIGSWAVDENMFANVAWGTDQAFAQTINSCSHCEIEFDLHLPILRDLDCYDDLVVISKQCAALQSYLI